MHDIKQLSVLKSSLVKVPVNSEKLNPLSVHVFCYFVGQSDPLYSPAFLNFTPRSAQDGVQANRPWFLLFLQYLWKIPQH